MAARRCIGCGQFFTRRPQSPGQTYCAKPVCQLKRKQRWLAAKLRADPDYRANQRHAQQVWGEQHRDYWQAYRASHADYVVRNRTQQRQRNATRRATGISREPWDETSRQFELRELNSSGLAKNDVWIVEIRRQDGILKAKVIAKR